MPWAAAGAVVAAGINAYSSSSAASTAAGASKDAAAAQAKQQAQTRADLLPYNTVGQSAAQQLQDLNTSGFTAGQPNYLDMANQNLPGQMTQAQLEATPGYQFNLKQGLQATQNAAAAKGLGVSGAALKGAATYATGLADSTYQNQFNNAQTRYQDYLNLNTGQQGNAQNLYSRLQGTASLGENAAAQTGQQGTTAAATQGNYLNQAGQASAAGTLGVGNALTGAANSYMGYNALQDALGKSTGGTGGYLDTTSTF